MDFNEQMAAGLRKQLGLSDEWMYKDLPWMAKPFWDKLWEIFGKDNYIMIVSSERHDWENGPFYHGQIMFNETARKNMIEFVKGSAA